MRQKWEKEEEEAMRRPVGPVHYQNVQFDGKSCFDLLRGCDWLCRLPGCKPEDID